MQMDISNREVLIMGILNVTPDSFYDGGRYYDDDREYVEKAVHRAKQMQSEGAAIIDLGAQSTRPGYQAVDWQEEIRRLQPVMERLNRETDLPVSVDTCSPQVAEAMLELGASIINDQSALRGMEWHDRKDIYHEHDDMTADMCKVLKKYKAPVILMHSDSLPQDCRDVMGKIILDLKERIDRALKHGLIKDQLIIDPGIGFGKTAEQNLLVIQQLKKLEVFGLPILLGASRKSFIGTVLDIPPAERLYGSLAAACLGIANGAAIIRTHDVKATVQAARLTEAVMNAGTDDQYKNRKGGYDHG